LISNVSTLILYESQRNFLNLWQKELYMWTVPVRNVFS